MHYSSRSFHSSDWVKGCHRERDRERERVRSYSGSPTLEGKVLKGEIEHMPRMVYPITRFEFAGYMFDRGPGARG